MSKQNKHNNKGDLVKLTGLWEEIDSRGHTYFSGKINAISRVLIMPNTFKKSDSEPDYFLYLAPSNNKKEGSRDRSYRGRNDQGKLNFR